MNSELESTLKVAVVRDFQADSHYQVLRTSASDLMQYGDCKQTDVIFAQLKLSNFFFLL